MRNFYLIFALLVIFSEYVMSSWDFAVSTRGRINFYTSDWKQVTSAAHQFDELSAITFDETEETIYFNDQVHTNGTIFSLKLSNDDNHRVERIVKKVKDEQVQGIAFDPLEKNLFWTDSKAKVIYQMNVDNKDREPSVLLDLHESSVPRGIAIDLCRRKLYWTNANHNNPSIERASLDGSEREVLIDRTRYANLFMPFGIVIDQFSRRIFWVDDLEGTHFSVESASLDGSDCRNVVQSQNHVPLNLAVDQSNIYWTDEQQDAVWQVPKDATNKDEPMKTQSFISHPKGIVIRSNFMSTQKENLECKSVVEVIKSELISPKTDNTTAVSASPYSSEEPASLIIAYCLNDGVINPRTNKCICSHEFQGSRCEIPICFNYCFEGTCHISSTGYAQCTCPPGYTGDRCEKDLCTNYCLNGGRCSIENGEPNCQCVDYFYGRNCEKMDVKLMCTQFCNKEIAELGGVDLAVLCDNCRGNQTFNTKYDAFGVNFNDYKTSCKDSLINKTAIFVSCGVVVSLALVFIIVKTIRHVYKPLRPRIKKTYVVHKNVVPTPLTCRPTTEQCEITIENCCNMNICDTPCFDPKAIQSEINRKEDKKTLINHSEDLMY